MGAAETAKFSRARVAVRTTSGVLGLCRPDLAAPRFGFGYRFAFDLFFRGLLFAPHRAPPKEKAHTAVHGTGSEERGDVFYQMPEGATLSLRIQDYTEGVSVSKTHETPETEN